MIVLDENLDVWQRQRLDSWGIHFRRIGGEIGRFGMDDYDEIVRLLHSLRRPTFFTRDQDFCRRWLSHPGYCLVYLEVKPEEAAQFIRRFLRHRSFRTQAQRMGKVVRIHQGGVTVWQAGMGQGKDFEW